MKLKIITGFRQDQTFSIEMEEAHKAYYLFLNPEQRGVFSNGVAIVGADIREIKPDYNGTMGWNPSHVLGDDDWNEIRSSGVQARMKEAISNARAVAQMPRPPINLSLTEATKILPARKELIAATQALTEKMKNNGER